MFMHRLLVAGSCLLLAIAGTTAALSADDGTNGLSKPYRLKVIGASMADQLATGLRWEFQGDKSYIVTQSAKAATGLVRKDVYDWQARLEEILKGNKMDIVVVALGGNDRQNIFDNGRRLDRFTVLWRVQYLRRLEKFMRTLTANVPVVYWVGLPMVRSAQGTKDFARLNSYFRDVGGPLGITYLDIYGRFANKGKYAAFGRTLAGSRRRLRKKDGVHFTMAGARKLGKIVGDMIRVDLKARQSRASSKASGLRSAKR